MYAARASHKSLLDAFNEIDRLASRLRLNSNLCVCIYVCMDGWMDVVYMFMCVCVCVRMYVCIRVLLILYTYTYLSCTLVQTQERSKELYKRVDDSRQLVCMYICVFVYVLRVLILYVYVYVYVCRRDARYYAYSLRV